MTELEEMAIVGALERERRALAAVIYCDELRGGGLYEQEPEQLRIAVNALRAAGVFVLAASRAENLIAPGVVAQDEPERADEEGA